MCVCVCVKKYIHNKFIYYIVKIQCEQFAARNKISTQWHQQFPLVCTYIYLLNCEYISIVYKWMSIITIEEANVNEKKRDWNDWSVTRNEAPFVRDVMIWYYRSFWMYPLMLFFFILCVTRMCVYNESQVFPYINFMSLSYQWKIIIIFYVLY